MHRLALTTRWPTNTQQAVRQSVTGGRGIIVGVRMVFYNHTALFILCDKEIPN